MKFMKKIGWGIFVFQKELYLGDGDVGYGVMYDGLGLDWKSMLQIWCDKYWRVWVQLSRWLLVSGIGERRYDK